MGDERRRHERIPVDIPARLLLAGGRASEVRIKNLGELGVLLSLADLEFEIHEGERAVLEHARIVDGKARGAKVHTTGAIVRVELDVDPAAILRQVAVYFDGGPKPVGIAK